jgi:hypothetical protein
MAFEEYVKEGIVESLLHFCESDDLDLKELSLKTIIEFTPQLKELEMFAEMTKILKEFMNFIRLAPFELVRSEYFCIFFTTLKLFRFTDVDFGVLDFEKLFELNINDSSPEIEYANVLIECQIGVDQELIKKLIDKLIGILNSDQMKEMSSPYLHFEEIVKFMKLDFKPWMPETIKLAVIRITDFLIWPEDYWTVDEELKIFTLLNTFIAVFWEDCEIYISKYKIVSLMINFMTQRNEDVRISFEFQLV